MAVGRYRWRKLSIPHIVLADSGDRNKRFGSDKNLAVQIPKIQIVMPRRYRDFDYVLHLPAWAADYIL